MNKGGMIMRVYCDECGHEFDFGCVKVKSKWIDKGIQKKYYNCSKCNHEFIVIITNAEIRKMISKYKALRNKYKDQFDADAALQEKYTDYTEMPDFEAELDKLTAKYHDEFDQLTAWETNIDTQITTNSAELEEVNAYMESIKSMLSSNIQEDFNYSLNG